MSSPLQDIVTPTGAQSPDGPAQMDALVDELERRLAMRFASRTDRDNRFTAADVADPVAGMLGWIGNRGRYEFHDGADWVDLAKLFGLKLIARDTGGGAANATAPGPVTNHPARTITDPFGAGVGYLVVVYAQTLFDNAAGGVTQLGISDPALDVPGVSIGGAGDAGRKTVPALHVKEMPDGGSCSFSSYVHVLSGPATWYADSTNNFAYYLAAPLAG